MKNISKGFKVLDNIDNEGYYARMAIAWAVSKCFVVFPKPTMDYLKTISLMVLPIVNHFKRL